MGSDRVDFELFCCTTRLDPTWLYTGWVGSGVGSYTQNKKRPWGREESEDMICKKWDIEAVKTRFEKNETMICLQIWDWWRWRVKIRSKTWGKDHDLLRRNNGDHDLPDLRSETTHTTSRDGDKLESCGGGELAKTTTNSWGRRHETTMSSWSGLFKR